MRDQSGRWMIVKELHDHNYIVIALRDLVEYVDPDDMPDEPLKIIQQTQSAEGKIDSQS